MIETLSLRNFKVLREVDVRLRPLTLVVGPNGSGKSSLLRALQYALDLLSSPSGHRSHNVEAVKSRESKGSFLLTLNFKAGGRRQTLSIVDREVGFERGGAKDSRPLSRRTLPKILDFDPKILATPSYLRTLAHDLPVNGEGLSWVLAGLQLEFPERFSGIVERLREIVPVVRGLRLKRVFLTSDEVGYELLFEMRGASGIPAHAISEGTLITLALLTVLSTADSGLILIENLERGLHPRAIGDLIAQIRSLQSHNPDLQIVATSHSPYLLDYLKADEVLLTSLDEEGYSSVKALSEHPDYERWKDVMAPGEFWSTVGESWVVQKT